MNDPGADLNYAQFLEFIADKPDLYEYVNERAVAMTRPSTMHQRIAGHIFGALQRHLDI